MRIIKSANPMQKYSNRLKATNNSVGFVPTMGYLHEGHLSLVRRSLKENDKTIVSVFINPAQFGPREDLAKYPRDFKRDENMLRKIGTDAVFYPTAKEMYQKPYHTYVDVECLTDALCGRSRPGHFRGVTTVVAKLLNIVNPDNAYFGQKDAQQAIVIEKMANDLNMNVKIKTLPIVRETDGLAMSSRNSYLSKKERGDATVLHKSLLLAKTMIRKGERSSIKVINMMKALVRQKNVSQIDYIAIVNPETLKPIKTIHGQVLIALAVYIGKTRLIDNLKLKVR